ncbi:GntR family transcriptional regulator [Phreatobacter stygius]|uniref:GntR family transcriptional regulator n=1 Tax=Phreatobacter stygius TaxID=1940610 RepID=A0A4D7B7E9_9HYPH|nr:GntR family transcriptional regulator [Phreatobacter stygius]QCI66925.1 GntR family transcriptional regulator [Phreatobacter stygius]
MILEIPPRPYLREDVYDTLRSHLITLAADIDAPVRLREEELARALGVSRTPVREALRRLEQDGFVTFEPRRGARLTPTTLKEFLDWLDIREMLEGLAARQAAVKASDADHRDLAAIFAGFDTETVVTRADDYAQANAAFHARIIALADNELLARTWNSFGHMKMAGLRFIERLQRGPHSLSEHHQIIAAIARRDPDQAEAVSRAHVRSLSADARSQLTSFLPEPS